MPCEECKRKFKNKGALEQHQAALRHGASKTPILSEKLKKLSEKSKTPIPSEESKVPIPSEKPKNLKCVGKKGCKKSFNSPSAMIMHLESGACPSNLTRKKIDALIFKYDTGNMITNGNYQPDNLLGLNDVSSIASFSWTSCGSGLSTPSTDSDDSKVPIANLSEYTFLARPGISMSTTTTATNEGFYTPTESTRSMSVSSPTGVLTPLPNGSTTSLERIKSPPFRCPRCPITRKPFKKLQHLEAHMESPAHVAKIYHCPDFLIASNDHASHTKPSIMKKKKEFSTLSGLTKHLEVGACEGGKATFEKAVTFVTERLEEMGLGDIRLIG
ncbi:hypothetical protein RUND412_002189 [Rhizina undulata]